MTMINVALLKVIRKLLRVLYVVWFHFVLILYYSIWPRPRPRPRPWAPSLGLVLELLASASASSFWPRLTSLKRTHPNDQQQTKTRNTFCGTWYLPHSQVHNDRTVTIIMAGCIAHARNGRISTSGLKSNVIIVFRDPDILKDAKTSAIRVHLRHT